MAIVSNGAAAAGLNTLFAQPYNLDARGFYFTNFEDFETKAQDLVDAFGAPVEEFEIMVIDGPDAGLLSACELDQSTLHWIEDIEALDEWQKPALFFLISEYRAGDISDALAKVEDLCIFEGTLQEAAEEYIDSTGLLDRIPTDLEAYFDYERYANDLRLGGDFVEFRFNGTTYVCTNANEV